MIRGPSRSAIEEGCRRAINYAYESGAYKDKGEGIHPRVGAVLLNQDGKEISGAPRRGDKKKHAEVMAISELERNRRLIRGLVHTAITTLEPCSYRNDHQQEICCAKRLVRLGVRQVVIGTLDPAYGVRGRGSNILQARGVYFTMFSQRFSDELTLLNREYLRHHRALLLSAAPRVLRGGLVQDDQEFDLSFGPKEVVNVLKGPEFQRLISAYYVEWANLCVVKSVHPQVRRRIIELRNFVMMDPMIMLESGPVEPLGPMTQRKRELDREMSRLLKPHQELIARYLAMHPGLSPGVELRVIEGRVADWWYNRRFGIQ